MIERRFWLALAALFAVGGVIQLPWPPSRFGAAFFLALAVGCAGMWLVLRLWEKSRVCRVLAVVGRVLFALFVLSFAAIQIFVIQAGMRTETADTQADYYIVLGALVNPDGQPSAALAARCDTAADLLAANPDSKAVLCGGQGGNEPCTEADSMFAYLTEQKGVDPARLLREDQSANTIENLENARTLIETAEAMRAIPRRSSRATTTSRAPRCCCAVRAMSKGWVCPPPRRIPPSGWPCAAANTARSSG